MTFLTNTRMTLLATVATVALVQPAFALDAQKFVDRLAASYAGMGYDIKPGAVSGSGDTVTVKGLTVGLKSAAAEKPLTLDSELTFSGVTENADGSYLADSLTMPDVEADLEAEGQAPGHISLKNIALKGLYVPPEGPVSFTNSLQLVQSASAGPLVLTRKGAEVLSFETIEADNAFTPEQGSAALSDVASTFDITGFKADLTSVGEEDQAAGATIKALDLEHVSGDINSSMTWTIASGEINVDSFVINLDDKGALSLLLDVSGFTPEVMAKLQAAEAATAGKSAAELEQANTALGMELLQAVSITSASIRYDDAGLANKLIDYFAAQQGADHASFVAGLKSMAPMMLAGVGIPALNDLVVPAVNTFLDEPQSLEVAVAPESPVSLITLMGAAANPAGLISMLGLAVTANQDDEEDAE